MARPSIEDLDLPGGQYRVDKNTDDPSGCVRFETAESARLEDNRRAQDAAAFLASGIGGRKLQRATKALLLYLKRAELDHDRPPSAASRVDMRHWRIRVSGALWQLVTELGTDKWVFFTVILPKWWVASSKLRHIKARRLKALLRAALYRAGARDASGWLYAMIHGEFDGTTEGFPLHFHGIATEGMIKVLKRLRLQPQFRRSKHDASNYPQVAISRKLKIDRPWGCLPDVLTYPHKSYWPQHNSMFAEDGMRRRFGPKHRITGIHLVRHLTWLHSQPIKDQVLLVHLSVIDGALVPAERGDARG